MVGVDVKDALTLMAGLLRRPKPRDEEGKMTPVQSAHVRAAPETRFNYARMEQRRRERRRAR